MTRLVCTEFDEFADALPGVDGRYLLTGSAVCDWKLQVVELDGVTLMAGQDGAANLFQASCMPGVYSLFVPLETTSGVAVNGELLGSSCVSWLVPGSEFHMRAVGAQRWLAVIIADPHLGHPGAPDDAVLSRSSSTRSNRASPHAIAGLQDLSQRILQLEGSRTDVAMLIAIRDQLLHASLSVVRSMAGAVEERRGRPSLSRQSIVDRSVSLIETRLDQPIQLSDLSAAAGVSERTIRSVFREQFGVSPHHYIMMKRMHGIHSAIRSAASHDTVTDICGRFGIWDFGRFSRAYQQQFGLLPSRMLARSKQKR